MTASLPVDNTIEALRVLQAHGWRARGFCFWRHIPGGKETLYSPVRGGWYCITGSGDARRLGDTLADAAYRLHGDEMLDAGLGALLLRGLSFEMGAEYTPVVEAVR